MLLIQLTGLSGAGKSSIAYQTKSALVSTGISVEVIDGDVFRKNFCTDLGFTQEDRFENLNRIAAHALLISNDFDVIIIAAMNPYKKVRDELEARQEAKTVFVKCPVEELIRRDPKGLYARSMLPQSDPNRLNNLPGINDLFETPLNPHLQLNTHEETLQESSSKLLLFIRENLPADEA